jgi:hypothetical protein
MRSRSMAAQRAALKWGVAGSVGGGQSAAQAKATKRLRFVWLDRIKANPKLADYKGVNRFFIAALAEELTHFSSFKRDGVYASNRNLAGRLQVSERQVRRGVFALRDQKHLAVERRGCGSTNLMVPLLDGARLYDVSGRSRPHGADDHVLTERTNTSGQFSPKSDLTFSKHEENPPGDVAQISLAIDLNSCRSLPPDPPQATEGVLDENIPATSTERSERPASGLPMGAIEHDHVAHGEVLEPGSELSFSAFWNTTRGGSTEKDPPGPARVYWLKGLTLEDKRAIAAVLDRDGVHLAKMWTITWLKTRAWEDAPLHRAGLLGVIDETEALASQNPFLQIGDHDPVVVEMAKIAARRDAQRQPTLPHNVLDRVWYRLGHGDVDRGFEIWKPLNQPTKDDLKAHERAGTLNDEIAVRIVDGDAA